MTDGIYPVDIETRLHLTLFGLPFREDHLPSPLAFQEAHKGFWNDHIWPPSYPKNSFRHGQLIQDTTTNFTNRHLLLRWFLEFISMRPGPRKISAASCREVSANPKDGPFAKLVTQCPVRRRDPLLGNTTHITSSSLYRLFENPFIQWFQTPPASGTIASHELLTVR